MATMDSDYSERIQFLLCTDNLSKKLTLFFCVIYIVLSIATISGNALILLALRKVSFLNPPSKLLYSCLAVSDLLVGLIVGAAGAAHYMMWNVQVESGRWMKLCVYSADVVVVSFKVLTTVSLETLTAISVDRLLALKLGLRYKQIVTLRRVQTIAVCVWIPSIAYAVILFWEYDVAKIYGYTLQSVCLLVSAVSYSKIFLTLRYHVAEVQERRVHQRQPNEGASLNMKRYRKTVSTAVWVLISLVICYIPQIIVPVLYTVNGPLSRVVIIWGFVGILVFLSSSLNPLLYCWKIKDVRQAVKLAVRELLCLAN